MAILAKRPAASPAGGKRLRAVLRQDAAVGRRRQLGRHPGQVREFKKAKTPPAGKTD
jgi:hypothetical protein